MMPLPSKALPPAARDAGDATDPPPGQHRADDDQDAADGGQGATPAQGPAMHRHSAPASGPPAP